jgi:D-alanine-D-alanine ligase-like ATP-grasp enzyme
MPAILERLAPLIGATVLLEPEFQIVGLIRFRNGRRSFFWHNKFNLNSVSAARIAQDKGYTSFFLRSLGYSVPESRTFFREGFRQRVHSKRGVTAARQYARELGWPVFVKPCRGSQGEAVAMATNLRELNEAAAQVFERGRVLVIEQACRGRDYRIIVLDGEVISAYERIPLSVMGDGRSTVAKLLAARQRAFDAQGRDTRIPMGDSRLITILRRSRMRLTSVPSPGTELRLMDAANLSLGGTTRDMTKQLHPSFAKLAAKIAADLDLRLTGIDLITVDATKPIGAYSILEVNSAPGLYHYGGFGAEHDARIDSLYLRVLKAVEKGP